jgi:putative endopeptidase
VIIEGRVRLGRRALFVFAHPLRRAASLDLWENPVKLKTLCLAGAAVLALSAVSASAEPVDRMAGWEPLFDMAAPAPSSGDVPQPDFGSYGFDASGVNKAAKPGDSFFDFANGAWYDRTVIPAEKSSYGMGSAVNDLTQVQLRSLIESAAAQHAAADTNPGKIGGLYNAFMDEARIEKLDAAPIKADLAAIGAIADKTEIARMMGRAQGGLGGSFFGVFVTPDQKDPDHYRLVSLTRGLGLPDRDYYLAAPFAAKKEAYRHYVAQMLTMVGWPEAEKRADEIVAMETAIAENSWTRTQARDRDKTYNPMKPSDLATYAPGFDWAAYYDAMGLGKADRVVLVQNTAFPKIAKVFADTPLETLKAWEAYRVVDEAAPLLSKRFVDAHFAFHGTAMSGATENRPRWKRAVSAVDGSLGEVLGKEYVAKYFPPESKAKMDDLVAQLRLALRHRIENLTWMSAETKAKALYKLDKFGVKIGYPVKWRDYSGLRIDSTDLVGDLRRSGQFEWAYNRGQLDQKVDPEEWGMTPQTVNAGYSPVRNEIVFPAAILQAPYFNPKADMAINFGAIGGVIGHEMTHGFDDQGRKSDGDGVLKDWWQPQDAAKFDAQAKIYGAQYDTYSVAPGVNVKGSQTMGENIADLGGVLIGLDAYHAWLKGKPAPVIGGYTGDQRVFLGWAQAWRQKTRPEALMQQVSSDVHSPARFRVDGPLRNVDAWYDAWGVKEGDKLYLKPEDRVKIW